MREVRISPDGNSVAIRSDLPQGSQMGWGVMNVGPVGAFNPAGGHWSPYNEVEHWETIYGEREEV